MVYVDDAENSFARMKMCHMIADSVPELHKMADALRLDRKHFQHLNPLRPHYDISKEYRKKAIKYGAMEITQRDAIIILYYLYERKE